MSKTRYDWWGYMKSVIRKYPSLKEQRKDLKSVQITVGFLPAFGTNEISRETETAAIKTLPGNAEREFQAVDRAISTTKNLKDGAERIKLIELVFWRKSHTLTGAAMICNVSSSTARRWHRDFIRLVGEFYGMDL